MLKIERLRRKALFMVNNKCFICKKRLPENMAVNKNNKLTWSVKFVVHLYTTRGIPPEFLI